MFKFDLQLFAELEIPGISEETLKELEAEEQGSQETAEEAAQPAEPQKQTEEPSADADSDNKQVEATDEFEDVKEGQTIPYDRFKSVNDRRKNAESRIKELEEQLKLAQAKQNVAEPKQTSEPPKAEPSSKSGMEIPNGSYTKEQEQRIYELALKNLQKKNNYSDEDMEAFLYADGMEKMNYEDAVRAEVKAVKDGILQYQAQQKAFNEMNAACVREFDALAQKFGGYQDAAERWNYISQERFAKLPERRQAVLKESFERLQAKKGTYADMEMVSDYLGLANDEWEKSHGKAVPAAKPMSNKYAQVDKLPKSGNIGGSGGADDSMNAERLAEILNEPGGWEKLTPEQQARILAGNF